MRRFTALAFAVAAFAALPARAADRAALEAEVAATETAFAKTMADRDLAAFSTFVSDEAVFFTGPEPLRGKTARSSPFGSAGTWTSRRPSPGGPKKWRCSTPARWRSRPARCSTGTASRSAATPRSGVSKRRAPGASCSTRDAAASIEH